MKLGQGLRRWATSGRMAMVVLLLKVFLIGLFVLVLLNTTPAFAALINCGDPAAYGLGGFSDAQLAVLLQIVFAPGTEQIIYFPPAIDSSLFPNGLMADTGVINWWQQSCTNTGGPSPTPVVSPPPIVPSTPAPVGCTPAPPAPTATPTVAPAPPAPTPTATPTAAPTPIPSQGPLVIISPVQGQVVNCFLPIIVKMESPVTHTWVYHGSKLVDDLDGTGGTAELLLAPSSIPGLFADGPETLTFWGGNYWNNVVAGPISVTFDVEMAAWLALPHQGQVCAPDEDTCLTGCVPGT